MKVIKPHKISLMHRSYGLDSQQHLVIKPIIFFELVGNVALVPEVEAWQRLSKIMPRDLALDEVMPKAQPEVMLMGSAYSPDGSQVSELRVRLRCAAVDKCLSVSGDRIWQKKWFQYKASAAATFSKMPVNWSRAFGSEKLPENPIGQGALSDGPAGEVIVALPNIEYPDDSLKKPRQIIAPAGFGPLEPTWEPRLSGLGKFDESFFDRTYPDLPTDTDFARYNQAPLDQRMTELPDDAEYYLENLHALQPIIQGLIPQVVPRAFVNIEGEFSEVTLVRETLWLFPEENLGLVIYCGETAIPGRNPQLAVDHLMAAFEGLADQPRPISYYQKALELRTHEDTALMYVFDEAQLSPAQSAEEQTALRQEHSAAVQQQNEVIRSNWEVQKSRYENESGQAVSESLAPAPVDPVQVIAPEALSRGDFSLKAVFEANDAKIQEAQLAADAQRQDQAAQSLESSVDDEQVLQVSLQRADPVPANGETGLDDQPALNAGMDVEALRKLELKGLAAPLEPQSMSYLKAAIAGAALRELVEERLSQGHQFAFRDLTGADLQGLDFAGLDLQGTIFECANLSGADLSGADLTGASFIGAKLDDCRFVKTQLAGTNFSSAHGANTNFTEAEFTSSAIFHQTVLTQADFSGAIMENVIMTRVRLHACCFENVKMHQSQILQSDLRGSEFTSCEFSMCQFLDCRLSLTQWQDVQFVRSVMLNCNAQLVSMVDCHFSRSQIAGDTLATASAWRDCSFSDSGFRNLYGTGCTFDGSKFQQADLGLVRLVESSFRSSCWSSCIAAEANFQGGDFSQAILSSCLFNDTNLNRCNLTDTNFYQSDVLLASFEGSNYSDAQHFMPLKSQRLAHES
jgi:uncharacterized protein YjbI with pentapeptide repeats